MKENLDTVELKLYSNVYDRLDKLVRDKLRFNLGFAKGWIKGAQQYIFGDTHDQILNHRNYE